MLNYTSNEYIKALKKCNDNKEVDMVFNKNVDNNIIEEFENV